MHTVKKLKNGLTLITLPVAGTKATTVLAMFPVGSRYEDKKLSGAAHFLEHMLFKGTKRRPTSLDITLTIEKYGADYNAFTNKEYTGYYIKMDGSKQGVAFDLLGDMIFNSLLDPAEVAKEKGAIVEELRMYQDNPSMAIDLLFDALLFGDHPLGWDIGGTAATVRAITQPELSDFHKRHYGPGNMILIVAGDIDRRRLPGYLKSWSAQGSVKGATKPSWYAKGFVPAPVIGPTKTFAERVAVDKKTVDQAQVIIGFPGLAHRDPLRYAASLLGVILGGGMSSRLFMEVREKRGLAYMVRAVGGAFRDSGQFYIQAGLDPSRLREAIKVIKEEIRKITTEPVSADELKFAKSSIAGRLALSMEDGSAQAEWYGKHLLFAKTMETPAQFLTQLNRVSVADVKKVAARLLQLDLARVAAIGPFTKEEFLTYW